MRQAIFHSIFTGEGGTGKSYLIRTVSKWAEKILEKAGQYKPKVLLLAFTGSASSLIGKYYFQNFYIGESVIIDILQEEQQFIQALDLSLEMIILIYQKRVWTK